MTNQAVHIENKSNFWEFIQKMQFIGEKQAPKLLREYYHEDSIFNGPEPINQLNGIETQILEFWLPFLRSFPNPQKRVDIFTAGEFKDHQWISMTGHYSALFEKDWLGIPASGQSTFIRFGEFLKIVDGKVAETITILDIPGVMEQAGIDIFPQSLGANHMVPSPALQDGIKLGATDPEEAKASVKLVEDMIAGLMQYDGESLESMPIEPFWHPQFMWYGPTGIGHSRGLQGFRDIHQRPFLRAFPDRVGGDHRSRVADGNYVASTGWPSIRATHAGSGWLGLPKTDKRIEMRVMDWWSCYDNLLVENWVFIDIPHLTKQFGYDLFERMEEIEAGRRK